jgi:four helix bundle protein
MTFKRRDCEIVTEIYSVTTLFPRDEIYGLTSQLRRAAVSVPSNIAEGQSQLFPKRFSPILKSCARIAEIETQIMIAEESGISVDPAKYRATGENGRGASYPERPDCSGLEEPEK